MRTPTLPEVPWEELYGKLCEAVDHAGYDVSRQNDGHFDLVPRNHIDPQEFRVAVNAMEIAANFQTCKSVADNMYKEVERLRGLLDGVKPELRAAGEKPEFKVESTAFETWARGELNYPMGQHPLHYLFTDDRTHAARQGWKAALVFAEKHYLGGKNAN